MQLPHQVAQFGAHRGDWSMRWGAIIRSNRFVLLGTMLLGVVIPEFLHPVFAPSHNVFNSIWPGEPGLYAAFLALFSSHIILRRVGILPLIDDKILIIPTFVTTFSVVALGLTLAIRSYGHFHLAAAFLIGIAWYFGVAMIRARTGIPRLAVIDCLPSDPELLSMRIEWVQLARPELPRDVQGIVFDSQQDVGPEWERLFARAVLRNIPVYDINSLHEMATGRVQLRDRPELIFGQLLPSQPYLRVKRVLDTILAVPALVIVSPIILLAAIAIWFESTGPVFFVQRRVGYQGRVFNCFKLRTMRTDLPGTAYTLEKDPRITRLGALMRKWRVDELPQILNIILGDMSWIGPRPEAQTLSRSYRKAIPYYEYRHAVRPGISGWAAVHQGNVGQVDAASRKLEYDFYYLKNFSLWLDVVIALMTIRTIFTGFGAR